jgi:hypothetical protein
MIYKHYGKLVSPKNAARYWQLNPRRRKGRRWSRSSGREKS